MLSIFSKLLDSNEKQIQRLAKTAQAINAIDTTALKLEDIAPKVQKLRESLQKSLKDTLLKDELQKEDIEKIKKELLGILPEMYAYTRHAAWLVANHKHYDVQLMGGTALFEGKLIELGTGEGKTLVATLPLSLYALCSKGTHIVTVNDYLARRDGEWCGHIYDALGLTTGVITSAQSYMFVKDLTGIKTEEEIAAAPKVPKLNEMHGLHLVPCSKKEAYACDVTYCTNNELGFDYLRDNMAVDLSFMNLRKLFYCIVDEADSILIDESRTPLIISTPAEQSNDLYVTFAKIVEKLKKDTDYTVDEKDRKVVITDQGIDTVEKLLKISNIWEDFMLAHHLENALSAKELFKNGDEYIIKENQVLIVDEFTGRLMEGRRFSEGIHQAIEAKEGVQIKEESKTVATITFQNFFRLYAILAGMTGTALTEAEEFAKIYNIDVVVIPTNRKLVRKDANDVIYKTEMAKFRAVIDEIKEKNKHGQPILVGTTSVEKSEILSELLAKEGVNHQVLNAKQHEKEAEIISHAGQKGQVTISTNMAGRGTDITLGDDVKDLGGLAVIGTERHESRRIDNQLRGRSGRQGDPGETRFYISLEDNLMRIFGGARIASIMTGLKFDENIPLEFGVFSRQIESAQKKVESMYFDRRKQLVEYDDVLNIQREIIYKRRKYILDLFSLDQTLSEKKQKDKNEERKTYLLQKLQDQFDLIIDNHAEDGELTETQFEEVLHELELIVSRDMLTQIFAEAKTTQDEWLILLKGDKNRVIADKMKEQGAFIFNEAYNIAQKLLSTELFVEKNKREMLRIIDILWMEHLESIEQLKEGIGLSSYSQKDPLIEYKNQAYILFENLIASIEYQSALIALKTEVPQILFMPMQTDEKDLQKTLEETGVPDAKAKKKKAKTHDSQKIGRNDLCQCGSGLKYKKCGALNTIDHQRRMARLAS